MTGYTLPDAVEIKHGQTWSLVDSAVSEASREFRLALYMSGIYLSNVIDPLASVSGFEWDSGNSTKSENKHGIGRADAEEVFLNSPLVADGQVTSEPRWVAFGKTFDGRTLAVAFTVRRNRVRVISARPMSRRERKIYA